MYINDAAAPSTSIVAFCTVPLILPLFELIVILFVPAVPVASITIISCPSVGLAGSVNVLAAVVSTKYLRPATNVILDEAERFTSCLY